MDILIMLIIFKKNRDVWEIKIIKEAFSFLLEKGLEESHSISNLEYNVSYHLSKGIISITYDIRTNELYISLITQKKTYLLLLDNPMIDSLKKNH